MRQAVAADVGNDELLVESEACSDRRGVEAGREQSGVGAVGNHDQLAARNAAPLEVLRKRLGDHHHTRRLRVQKVRQALQGSHGWASVPHQAELDDGFGPQVAHFEHERHALRARQEPG